jgi:hypothetical protein
MQIPAHSLTTPHTYTQFITNNQEIISLPSSIHTKLYDYIMQNRTHATFETTKTTFPFLPDALISEAMRCTHPLTGYKHLLRNNLRTPPRTNHTDYTNQPTHFTTWNISSLKTSVPCLQSLLNQHTPAILTLQETKLTSKKSPKYLQRLFSQYKLIFNNTHMATQYNMQRGTPYIPPQGGLLTLIHKNYAYPNNITKIPIASKITPYFQIIKLNNSPLTPILIPHLYMPTHLDYLHLILFIIQTITSQINRHPNTNIILCGDFNRDIALQGHTQGSDTIPPQHLDHQWRQFTQNLNLTYIPNNTTYTRQGGHNYTHTSLLDGYFIKSPTSTTYTSHTDINLVQKTIQRIRCKCVPSSLGGLLLDFRCC